jgi:hypothetical protein
MNNSIWNTCIGEAIRKAKLSGTLIPSNEVDEIISELEKLKRTTPKEPETVQGNVYLLLSGGKPSGSAYIIKDDNELEHWKQDGSIKKDDVLYKAVFVQQF